MPDSMMEKLKSMNGNGSGNGKIEVPTWVMAMTYIMCWAFAAALIIAMLTGHVENKGVIIGTIIYLITWPVVQLSPNQMLKSILPP